MNMLSTLKNLTTDSTDFPRHLLSFVSTGHLEYEDCDKSWIIYTNYLVGNEWNPNAHHLNERSFKYLLSKCKFVDGQIPSRFELERMLIQTMMEMFVKTQRIRNDYFLLMRGKNINKFMLAEGIPFPKLTIQNNEVSYQLNYVLGEKSRGFWANVLRSSIRFLLKRPKIGRAHV